MPKSDLTSLLGPWLVGSCLNILFYGTVVPQTYSFFAGQQKRKDSLFVRSIVVTVVLFETIHTILTSVAIWQIFAKDFGNIFSATQAMQSSKALATIYALGFTTAFTAQLFFAWRVYRLLAQKWVAGVICCCALAAFASGVTFVIGEQSTAKPFVRPPALYRAMFQSSVFLSMTADLLITVSLATFLLRRMKTGLPDTDDILSRIITMTVETGLLTTAVASVEVGMFISYPETSFAALACLPLPKLYTISLLCSLNMRTTHRNACNMGLWVSAFESKSGSLDSQIIINPETIESRSSHSVDSKWDTRLGDDIRLPPPTASNSDNMQPLANHC